MQAVKSHAYVAERRAALQVSITGTVVIGVDDFKF